MKNTLITDKIANLTKIFKDDLTTKIISCKIIIKLTKYVLVEYTLSSGIVIKIPLKIITMENLLYMIDTNDSINLDNCYIKNFDIEKCKTVSGSIPIFKNFSAKMSYFDGYTNFSDAQFQEGNVDFSRAVFSGEKVSFFSADFKAESVNFIGVNIKSPEVDFNNAVFDSSSVNFLFSLFNVATINFATAAFNCNRLIFSWSRFNGSDMFFSASHFHSCNVVFSSTYFDACKISFHWANFEKNTISFASADSTRTTLSFSACKLLSHNNLRIKNIMELNLLDCIIDGTLLINSAKNYPVHIEKLSLLDTKNLGSIFIDWDTAQKAISSYTPPQTPYNDDATFPVNHGNPLQYLSPTNSMSIKNFHRLVSLHKSYQVKLLKENYHKIGEYDFEDSAFVEYMRYNRKSQNKMLCLFSWVLDKIAGYGTNPLKLFFSMIATILFFGFLYSDCFAFTSTSTQISFSKSFFGIPKGIYFSIITFLTIGYGDISPNNSVTAILAGLEGFLGLFLMSYFTVAVVRKTLK